MRGNVAGEKKAIGPGIIHSNIHTHKQARTYTQTHTHIHTHTHTYTHTHKHTHILILIHKHHYILHRHPVEGCNLGNRKYQVVSG